MLNTLYEKTGGEYWSYKTNWLSENPVEEWQGVYLDASGKLNGLWLQGNNLVGEFPEVLVDVMNNSSSAPNLNYNRLYGEIPESLKNHSRWSDWGWHMIAQKPYGDPVVQNYNLYAPNVEVEHLIENESMESNLHEIIKKNKLTQIIKGYDNSNKLNSTFIINELSKDRVNLHLDYQSKGLGTVIFVGNGTDEEVQSLKNEVLSVYGNVDEIHWLKGKSPLTGAYYSSSYVFDSNAQLVYYAYYNAPASGSEQNIISMSHNNYAKALKTVLGEPAEHSDFTPGFYTSTDYSKDGEVVTLQKAEEGNGINLIFLGDGFVDKDMDTGGYYEEFMKKAMENFFSMEPYKTFRNRFNVYTVKWYRKMMYG